jgi:hypothetical protein
LYRYFKGVWDMPVKDVQEVLTDHMLWTPDLEMLRPTEKSYTCLLLQPSGPIFANNDRIGNLDTESAAVKSRNFLELAQAQGAHLAVTPEYYLPWSVLRNAIEDNVVPEADALWVLGCESITPDNLSAFKQEIDESCLVIYEPFDTLPANGVLLDPVVHLFCAKSEGDATRLVALVQFKTCPSRDNVFFEQGVLKRGTIIYRFRGVSGHLSTTTVICSDAFSLSNGLIGELIDRSTIIHIQLNPDPRNTAYRAYRKQTFETNSKFSDCHIVCLNWAQNIEQHGDAGVAHAHWNNIAGSTWYCPEDGCSLDDNIIVPNHKKGLFYTCLKQEHRHALLFHYDEAVFELRVPKLLTTGQELLANRNGPSAIRRYMWADHGDEWTVVNDQPDTGFEALLQTNPEAEVALTDTITNTDVLGIERILALSAGTISGMEHWYLANNIDSCQMEPDEVVLRITVAQDHCLKASDFRHHRLARFADLHHMVINTDTEDWPTQIKGINNHARLVWSNGNPHFNVMSDSGQPTLIVNLGESPPPDRLEDVPDMLCQLLRLAGGINEKRLCIVYRHHGEQKFASIPGLTRYDDAQGDATDILSVQPIDTSVIINHA